jgi:hypothetical protein
VLACAVGSASKRSLIVMFTVSGPSTLFWRKAPGQGAGRSQHRDSRRRSRREQVILQICISQQIE